MNYLYFIKVFLIFIKIFIYICSVIFTNQYILRLMYHNPLKQYEIADNILSTICEIGGVSFMEFCSYKKTEHLNILRGLYCYIAREKGVASYRAARLICRSRCNIINQARKYWHYMQVKDPNITKMYNIINSKLKQ